MLCVAEGHPYSIGQHISNTQTKCQLSAGDEKSIPALKINILLNTTNSIPYLVPTQFQESIFPRNPFKNTVLDGKSYIQLLPEPQNEEGCTGRGTWVKWQK